MMQFKNAHILLVDYQQSVLDQFSNLLSQRGAIAHPCKDRVEALGRLWALVDAGIQPRAVITNWILQDPGARAFYKLIEREVYHTSVGLLENAVKMDPDDRTILICYTTDPQEAVGNLSKLDLLDRVAVVNMNHTTVPEMVQILMIDERTKIIQRFKEEVKTDSFTREIRRTPPLSGLSATG